MAPKRRLGTFFFQSCPDVANETLKAFKDQDGIIPGWLAGEQLPILRGEAEVEVEQDVLDIDDLESSVSDRFGRENGGKLEEQRQGDEDGVYGGDHSTGIEPSSTARQTPPTIVDSSKKRKFICISSDGPEDAGSSKQLKIVNRDDGSHFDRDLSPPTPTSSEVFGLTDSTIPVQEPAVSEMLGGRVKSQLHPQWLPQATRFYIMPEEDDSGLHSFQGDWWRVSMLDGQMDVNDGKRVCGCGCNHPYNDEEIKGRPDWVRRRYRCENEWYVRWEDIPKKWLDDDGDFHGPQGAELVYLDWEGNVYHQEATGASHEEDENIFYGKTD